MRKELLDRLRVITAEERAILEGQGLQRELYTTRQEFVVDSRRLLERGKLIEIRPHTRFIHFPPHRHNYVELVCMCAGSTTHIVNGRERITLEEGDMLFLSQKVSHEILPAAEGDIAVNFILLPEFFERPISMIERENVMRDFFLAALTGESTGSSYLHIQAGGLVPVENLMESMIWTLLNDPTDTNTLNQTSMGLMLMNLSRFADRIRGDSPIREEQKLVFSILRYIETDYRSATLEEISSRLRQPPYAMTRLLKKHTGQNFKALLQARRLQQAAYLLENTPLTIDAILSRIGYENGSYFHRIFRSRYGCSPREYRLRSR